MNDKPAMLHNGHTGVVLYCWPRFLLQLNRLEQERVDCFSQNSSTHTRIRERSQTVKQKDLCEVWDRRHVNTCSTYLILIMTTTNHRLGK